MPRLALSALALLALAVVARAQAPDELTTCALTGSVPTKPLALSFCHRFNDEACCIPGHDAENEELFTMMRDVGLSCRIRGDVRDDPIARLYCMNCDPNQPRYVRLPHFNSDNNDTYIMIDKTWAMQSFPMNLTTLDQCGLLISATCQGDNGPLDDWDRYVCGDDLVIPSGEWDNSLSETENLEAFLNFENFGTPNLEFIFKLVDSTANCTDAQIEEDFPDCLFTAAQLDMRYNTVGNMDELAAFASGGFVSAASLILTIASAMIAALFH